MSDYEIPNDLHYSKTHEWVRREPDGSMSVGITAYAQHLLGDLVHIELPEIEINLKAGDEAGVVESVKAASDLYSPLTGEVVAVNEALIAKPELLNEDPYTDGWIFQIDPEDPQELDELMDAHEYEEYLAQEEH
jgi:glycine cleavage system H protein